MSARSALFLCVAATVLTVSPRAQAQPTAGASTGWGRDPAETETLDDTPKPQAEPSTAPAPAPEQEAEPAADAQPAEQLPFAVGLELVLGSGDLGDPGAQPGSFASRSFMFAASYRADQTSFGVRLPFTSASIDVPNLPSSSQSAFGNLELSMSNVLSSSEHLEIPFALALVLPTGAGDPWGNESNRRHAAVQQTAAMSRGSEDNPLFLPRHFAVVPRIAVELEKGILQIEAHETLEVVLRAGALKPREPVQSNLLAIASVTGASGFAKLLRGRAWVGLRGWLAYDLRSSYELDLPGVSTSRTQLAVEPQARGQLGPVRATLGYVLPVGGDLGDAGVHGFRIGATASF